MQKEIHVHCPCCRNSRLFDLQEGSTGLVKIKCPRCGAVIAIQLHNAKAEKVRTEQIGA